MSINVFCDLQDCKQDIEFVCSQANTPDKIFKWRVFRVFKREIHLKWGYLDKFDKDSKIKISVYQDTDLEGVVESAIIRGVLPCGLSRTYSVGYTKYDDYSTIKEGMIAMCKEIIAYAEYCYKGGNQHA